MSSASRRSASDQTLVSTSSGFMVLKAQAGG
jgi:hypothetical protein